MKTNSFSKYLSKGKIVIAIALFATLMMSSMNVNLNSMNAHALNMTEFDLPDVGQSLECVIVVVGCDGTGSVGSSGDTIIGSNNNNGNNLSNTPNPPNTPEPPTCEGCFDVLSPEQLTAFLTVMTQTFPNNFPPGTTLEQICSLTESLPPANQQIGIGQISTALSQASVPIDQDTIDEIIECLHEVFDVPASGNSLKSSITSGDSFGFK
jgi:hypothetical protein